MMRIPARQARRSAPTRASGGFTLTETMVALLIMVLLAAVAANGVPVAYQTYLRAVEKANAQVALSTTITELRDELCMADVSEGHEPVASGDSVWFYADGAWRKIQNAGDGGIESNGLVRVIYTGAGKPAAIEPGASAVTLVPNAAISGSEGAREALEVSFEGISFADGVFTVSGLKVTDGSGAELDGVDDYKVRAALSPG